MQQTIQPNLMLTRQQRLDKMRIDPDTGKNQQWDMIIVGGGITGAGIFKRACMAGLKVLLLEQKDFAWGSSSRSSKMVHGGLRYIAQGQIKLTQESVQERKKLLNAAPYLIEQQSFAMSHYQKQFPWPWIFNSLLSIYDAFGRSDFFFGKKQHQYWQQSAYQLLVPHSNDKNAIGGTQFFDAMTDDARLVLRLIQEGQQLGGLAVNYALVQQLVSSVNIALENDSIAITPLSEQAQVVGVKVQAAEMRGNCSNNSVSLTAKLVVNATGAWSNQLKSQLCLRPLRGSHLIIASWRLPVASAISVLHPKDKRPVQIFPWQNVTVVGTTDVEHSDDLNLEPAISQAELDYLLMAVQQQFPAANISEQDIISTFAGVRPVITDQKALKKAPEQEKREHTIIEQAGLITIAGGKLTTFDLIAQQVLAKAISQLSVINSKCKYYPSNAIFDDSHATIFNEKHQQISAVISIEKQQHIQGCYGKLSAEFIRQGLQHQSVTSISYSKHLWAELIWAVRYEQVQHLDDLLLRRTRIGNVLPSGALKLIDIIKYYCQPYLLWHEDKWQQEINHYQQLWQKNYFLPQSKTRTKVDEPAKNTGRIDDKK